MAARTGDVMILEMLLEPPVLLLLASAMALGVLLMVGPKPTRWP